MNVAEISRHCCLGPGLDVQSSKKSVTSLRDMLSCLTREEEVLIPKNHAVQTWRGAESVLVQPTICATKNRSCTGQKQRMFQEEDGFDFREAAIRRLISAELRRFSLDSVTVHPPDVFCRSGISLKNQQKMRGKCNPLVNHVCNPDSRTIEKRETGLPWCNLACVDSGSRQCEENSSTGEVGSDEKSSNHWEEAGHGRQCDQKTWHCVRSLVGG